MSTSGTVFSIPFDSLALAQRLTVRGGESIGRAEGARMARRVRWGLAGTLCGIMLMTAVSVVAAQDAPVPPEVIAKELGG